MRAVILAGGRGTRLRPYTTVLPKPLVPVGDRPVLELIIRQLGRAGFERLDLLVGHLGGLIKTYLDEATDLPEGMELAYHWEHEPLGTAGALHQLGDVQEPLLAMNGDIVTTLDYAELMRSHASSGAALTIAVHHKDVAIDLGVIESQDGFVTGYIEKPTLHYTVSMGVYVYAPRAVALVPPGYFDLPDLVRLLLETGEKVGVFPFDGTWFDIGTPADHERAMTEVEAHPELFDA